MMTTDDGKPVEFIMTPASTADITAFKLMEIDLARGASIYREKAYTQYSFEDDLQEFEKIRLIADRKKNAKRQHSGCVRYLQTILKKRIETTFSQLTSMLPRKIHATTKKVFCLSSSFLLFLFLLNKRSQLHHKPN